MPTPVDEYVPRIRFGPCAVAIRQRVDESAILRLRLAQVYGAASAICVLNAMGAMVHLTRNVER